MTTSASATEGVYDLRPPELVEPILVDAEVVRELVENRDPDLVLQHGRIVTEFLLERQAIDRDLVGQGPRVGLAPLGQRDPEVEAEEVGVFGVLVLDHDLDVRHRPAQLGRQRLDGAADVVLEVGRQYAGRSLGGGRPAAKSLMVSAPKAKPPMCAK